MRRGLWLNTWARSLSPDWLVVKQGGGHPSLLWVIFLPLSSGLCVLDEAGLHFVGYREPEFGGSSMQLTA